jgi:DNA-binding CsgD family transcriptional regulator
VDERTHWLRAASELLNAPTPERAHDLFIEELMRLTRADVTTRVGLTPHDPQAISITVAAREAMPPREHWPVASQARAHPLSQYYATTTDRSPVRLTDLVAAGWTLDDDAREAMAALDITVHQMTLPCSPRGADFDGWVVLNADGFRDADLSLLTELQPLLVGLDRHIRLFSAAVGLGVPVPQQDPALTPRERVVLDLMAVGATAERIAARLAISARTVHKHQEHLYRKLGACDRLSAVLAAQRRGLLPGPDGFRRVAP